MYKCPQINKPNTDHDKTRHHLEISTGSHSKLYATKGKEWKLLCRHRHQHEPLQTGKKTGPEAVCCDAFNLHSNQNPSMTLHPVLHCAS